MGAAAFLHEDRVGIVGAVVTGNAEWNTLEVLLVGCGGFGGATLEGIELFLQCGIHLGLQEYQAECSRPLECARGTTRRVLPCAAKKCTSRQTVQAADCALD